MREKFLARFLPADTSPDTFRHSFGTEAPGIRHTYVDYYDPASGRWKAYEKQLDMDMDWIPTSSPSYVLVHKPPVNLRSYIRSWSEGSFWVSNTAYAVRKTTMEDIRTMFLNGVWASEMKQWLLYS